jgi:hypothetical protein
MFNLSTIDQRWSRCWGWVRPSPIIYMFNFASKADSGSFLSLVVHFRSRDSLVGKAAGYWLEGPVSISGSVKFFQTDWGPPIHLFNGCEGRFPRRLKRQGRENDHSSPSSAEVKKVGAIPPLPHMSSWHSALLIKHRTTYLIFWFIWLRCQ